MSVLEAMQEQDAELLKQIKEQEESTTESKDSEVEEKPADEVVEDET